MINEHHISFCPFGMEIFGALGPGALAVLDEIAEEAARITQEPCQARVKRELMSTVAVALQNGNGLMLDAFMRTYSERHGDL